MPKFSSKSLERLHKVHPSLSQLFKRVIAEFDMTVIEGARTPERQKLLVEQGASKTLNSKHIPRADGWAYAVDVAPYPIDWNNLAPYYYMAGRILQLAMDQGIKVRWGGNWDMDSDLDDETFLDLVHFELLG